MKDNEFLSKKLMILRTTIHLPRLANKEREKVLPTIKECDFFSDKQKILGLSF
jgi:hypothetical protein